MALIVLLWGIDIVGGIRDSYGVQMADGKDVALILAINLWVDAMARLRKHAA